MLRLRVPLPRLIGPGEVIAGEGALAALQTLPAVRVAIVASERAYADPVVQRWRALPAAFQLERFAPSWHGEPSLPALAGTVHAITQYRPDWIVAIGGGSIIDGARLCWALYEHPTFPAERLARPFALPPLRALARFVAVPTTAGTGAECSSAAIITDPETGHKVPVVTHDFLPDVAILDPRLTMSLPVGLTVATALDALAHALEGRVSKLTNPLVDDIADSSATTILGALAELLDNGETPELRSRLQIAAYYAGQVQNLRLVGLAHAVAHRLGPWQGAHAAAVGYLLPLSLSLAARSAAARAAYDGIARRSGFADAMAMIDAIRTLPGRAGLATRLRDVARAGTTFSAADAGRLAEQALADPIARFLPYELSAEELTRHLQEAW
ncbi:MAG: iron-containing alcohol dehydrogenase [Enhydrobacter sp.]|nr:MAG: iron-containing alcohol dehydrogenase [Enhydrobacter sp.]